ncbi:ABC transporter ATP-binding protein [Chlamydia abortus]|nr:ABC transporter ATP-binding protein [Chlamydia abortus]SGA29621.1 ABC transporter ATP-binding protein [Chlamydia abortus]SGA30731.1 ABC transporter ATP-binding protein [Chlamydia abortus]SGA31503.1 ABC transporter ATP-binding protein [Chlamydia abortus]
MKIDFEKVSIGYNKKNIILNDVSFSILDGEMVAIIGSSGSGKTTIFNAILKIASLLGGSILIDNKSIYAYSRRD